MIRLKAKLLLWETPGFSQFIEDLSIQLGPEFNVKDNTETLRKKYLKEIQDMEPTSKFKQGKLL